MGGDLTLNLTDLWSSLLICRPSANLRQLPDRLARDPIGACSPWPGTVLSVQLVQAAAATEEATRDQQPDATA